MPKSTMSLDFNIVPIIFPGDDRARRYLPQKFSSNPIQQTISALVDSSLMHREEEWRVVGGGLHLAALGKRLDGWPWLATASIEIDHNTLLADTEGTSSSSIELNVVFVNGPKGWVAHRADSYSQVRGVDRGRATHLADICSSFCISTAVAYQGLFNRS